MLERFGSLFFEGKTDLFSSVYRFFATTTVFIAMKIDFVAMKTVVITHDLGSSRQRRRSSWKNTAHLMAARPEKTFAVSGCGLVLVCEYPILRELRFDILFYYLQPDRQIKSGIRTICPSHEPLVIRNVPYPNKM